jgi:hypothetical protein
MAAPANALREMLIANPIRMREILIPVFPLRRFVLKETCCDRYKINEKVAEFEPTAMPLDAPLGYCLRTEKPIARFLERSLRVTVALGMVPPS